MDKNFLDSEGLEYYNERLVAYLRSLSWPSGGVESFAGRSGDVEPQSGDYTADMVGAVPTSRTVNGKPLSSNISLTASDISALPISGGTLTGNLTIKGSGNYGTKINLGDGDYVHISEPTDDCMEIKAKKVNFALSDTSDTNFTVNGENPFGSSISLPLTVANGGTGGTTPSKAVYNLTQPLFAISASSLLSNPSTSYIPLYYGSSGFKVMFNELKSAIGSEQGYRVELTGTGTSNTLSFNSGTSLSSNSFIFGVSKRQLYDRVCTIVIGSFKNQYGIVFNTNSTVDYPGIVNVESTESSGATVITLSSSSSTFSDFVYSQALIDIFII